MIQYRSENGYLIVNMDVTPMDTAPQMIAKGIDRCKGWAKLFNDLLVELQPYKGHIIIEQIVTNLGSLRVDYSLINITTHQEESIHDIIHKYEELSVVTCELCGCNGEQVVIDNWMWTLCCDCYNKKRNFISSKIL